MTIPYWINIVISIATFVLALFEYYRVDPEDRVWNRYFGLAVGAILIALINIFMKDPWPSLGLFLLAVIWSGVTLYQLRILPERPDKGR